MWRSPIYILMLLWQVRNMQFPVLLGRIASLRTAGAGYDPSTRTVLRWLRRNHMLLKCCIGVVPNQYFVITCTHHPTPVPPISPSRWPMVIPSLYCVSAAAWVLNYINWPTPQYPSLIVLPVPPPVQKLCRECIFWILWAQGSIFSDGQICWC